MHIMTDCVHLSCLYIWYDRHLIHIWYDRYLTRDCITGWLILFKLFVTCYLSTCNILIDILVYSIVSTLLFCSFYFYTCIILCSHVICTCTSPFILTHSLGVLTLWICTSRSLHVILLIRYLERIIGISRSLEFSLFDYWCSQFLLFHLFLDFWFIGLITCFIFLFICYHVWSFICYIAELSCHHSYYIACSGYFRISVYTWGIFLTYIRYRLSSRLRFHVFCEAGHDKFCSLVLPYILNPL